MVRAWSSNGTGGSGTVMVTGTSWARDFDRSYPMALTGQLIVWGRSDPKWGTEPHRYVP